MTPPPPQPTGTPLGRLRPLFALAGVLVVPLAFLLFVQWPLRELVQAHARLANDIGQIVFALYAAVAVTAATLSGSHLSAGHAHSGAVAGWRRWALLACVLPWAAFTLWAAWPGIAAATLRLERFGDTLTPGFFLIQWALGLLLLLVLAAALAMALAGPPGRRDPAPPR